MWEELPGSSRKPLHGIVTLLDAQYSATVESIWNELRRDCGLVGIHATPVAHFSWQIAEYYEIERIKRTLADIAKNARPFIAYTSGLGLFSGELPVLYISIVKDANLMAFHQRLWRRTARSGRGFSQHYTPQFWMPHITLSHGDVNNNNLVCIMERLSFRSFTWDFMVDNLAFIFQPDQNSGYVQFSFPFGG